MGRAPSRSFVSFPDLLGDATHWGRPAMSRYELRCRGCRATYPATDLHTCAECLSPLEVIYADGGTGEALRAAISAGPTSLWRFAPPLPIDRDAPHGAD